MIKGFRCDVKKALSKEEVARAQQLDKDRSFRGDRSRGNTRGGPYPPSGGGGGGGYGPGPWGPPPQSGWGPGWGPGGKDIFDWQKRNLGGYGGGPGGSGGGYDSGYGGGKQESASTHTGKIVG